MYINILKRENEKHTYGYLMDISGHYVCFRPLTSNSHKRMSLLLTASLRSLMGYKINALFTLLLFVHLIAIRLEQCCTERM